MRSPFANSPEFQKLLSQGSGTDLVRIALEIARDAYPTLEPSDYLGKIEALASRIKDRCPKTAKPRQVLGQINWVLFVEEGFQGNREDYYDPRNSFLNEVIERKTGIPITLSVLYATWRSVSAFRRPGSTCRRTSCSASGRRRGADFVDPFHSGDLLDRRGCERRVSQIVGRPVELTDVQLAPCGHREIVARMLRNLKAVYLHKEDFPAAYPILRRLAALNPEDPEEQRDFGMLCLQLDRPAEAITPLQAYLDAQPESEDAAPSTPCSRPRRREVSMWN